MNKEEILSLIKANRIGWLSTVEGDKPHVRAMGTYKVDEQGILIQITTVKDVYKQLVQNPNIELCYNDQSKGIQVRISGTAQFLEDQAIKEEVLAARPFLKSLVAIHGDDVIKIFRVANAVANVWTLDVNFESKTYVEL
jgi:pyridoxamine 5'-phosphate oxidase